MSETNDKPTPRTDALLADITSNPGLEWTRAEIEQLGGLTFQLERELTAKTEECERLKERLKQSGDTLLLCDKRIAELKQSRDKWREMAENLAEVMPVQNRIMSLDKMREAIRKFTTLKEEGK